jgi:hypothetical protein
MHHVLSTTQPRCTRQFLCGTCAFWFNHLLLLWLACPAVAHSKEAEVDHNRFNASYKAMQFDPELLSDQRRRGWGDRCLSSLGIEQRPDGGILVVVVVERIDGKLLR